MRHALLALALVALAAPVAATGDRVSHAKTPRTVLAVQNTKETSFLLRLDARSLKPVSKRVSLGDYVSAWALSPDGRRLALVGQRDDFIRLFDTRRLRRLPSIRSWNQYTSALVWLAPRRLVWLGADRVFAADPVARKHLSTDTLDGAVIMSVERSGNTLALLAAPTGEVGPARLAVLGAAGHLRSVTLTGIRAGMTFDPVTMNGEEARPGLAFASSGRVFVVGAGDDPIAEVALQTMSATYHRSQRSRSLLTKLHDWLEPQAVAKVLLPGSSRRALWLGDGRLAIWGFDVVRTGPDQATRTPTGLSIVDTTDWSIKTVDAHAEQVALAAGTVLTTAEGAGLSAYSTDGQRRYQVFGDETVWLSSSFGSRAFIHPRRGHIRVIDATTGRLLGTRREVPWILHSDFTWW